MVSTKKFQKSSLSPFISVPHDLGQAQRGGHGGHHLR
jgi:hypothetical protein